MQTCFECALNVCYFPLICWHSEINILLLKLHAKMLVFLAILLLTVNIIESHELQMAITQKIYIGLWGLLLKFEKKRVQVVLVVGVG